MIFHFLSDWNDMTAKNKRQIPWIPAFAGMTIKNKGGRTQGQTYMSDPYGCASRFTGP